MRGLAGLAGLGGLAGALGQSPWGLWPVALLGFAALAYAVALAPGPRAAFGLAWLGALAMFALALAWIVEPFFVEPERHGWMAPFALVILPGGLALFWGAAGWLAARLAAPGPGRGWAFGLALTGAEALRGHALGGFPWAMPGHIWIDTPLSQLAALGGALGLTGLVLAVAAGLAALALAPRRGAALAAAVPLALAAAGWAWGQGVLARPMPPDRELRLRLVQPNADQSLKWDPAFAELYFFRHLDLTAAPHPEGRAPDLVLWAETAVPFFLDAPGDGLAMAAEAAGGVPLVLGIQRRGRAADGGLRYHNSLAVIDPAGVPVAVYDKHHLVPFGEYIPWVGPLADRPGFEWLAAFTGSALLGYTPGPGPVLLDLGAAGRVLPLICYEAVFPRHLRTPERPDWVMQLTNDAWFGEHSGPFQHLALARLRAIEQGLPLVRVANTGVSAVIDARGRVLADLGLGVSGALDADLPAALPPTAYARTGDLPWHLALIAALAAAALRRRIDTSGARP
jgi:apolipoprotein N-acyltransferase